MNNTVLSPTVRTQQDVTGRGGISRRDRAITCHSFRGTIATSIARKCSVCVTVCAGKQAFFSAMSRYLLIDPRRSKWHPCVCLELALCIWILGDIEVPDLVLGTLSVYLRNGIGRAWRVLSAGNESKQKVMPTSFLGGRELAVCIERHAPAVS